MTETTKTVNAKTIFADWLEAANNYLYRESPHPPTAVVLVESYHRLLPVDDKEMAEAGWKAVRKLGYAVARWGLAQTVVKAVASSTDEPAPIPAGGREWAENWKAAVGRLADLHDLQLDPDVRPAVARELLSSLDEVELFYRRAITLLSPPILPSWLTNLLAFANAHAHLFICAGAWAAACVRAYHPLHPATAKFLAIFTAVEVAKAWVDDAMPEKT